MPTIVATPGASNANSYLLLSEGQAYWDSRLFTDAWEDSLDKSVALIWATRTLDAMFSPRKVFVPGNPGYYRTGPAWTGTIASDTQSLAWPRTGMYDRFGRAIASTVIPQALKDAVAELAGQLSKTDLTVDNDVIVQGIKSVAAGSVNVSFKDAIYAVVIPGMVWNLLVPSWYTPEKIESVYEAQFDVI